MSTPTGSTAVGRAGRYMPAVVTGAVVGVLLGVWAGNVWNVPGAAGLMWFFPLAIAGLLVALLLMTATVMWSTVPLVAILAVVAGFWLGLIVAPGAPGSIQRVPGTGTAGTRADPSSLWSGTVTCEWPKGESTSAVEVRGYDVPLDPALLPDDDAGWLAKQGVHAMTIIQVNLDGTVYMEGRDGRIGLRHQVAIERAPADVDTGTAVLSTDAGDIVFSWTCAGGP